MPLVSMRELLDHAAENGYGIPAFNVNNLEQVQAVMEAAKETGAPVILQASAGARKYAGEPFIDVMPPGSLPDTRSVRASNTLRIAVHRPPDSDLALVIAVLDNLVKGAAGQAIQNMNLMFGLPETVGLTAPPVLP